jgi:hypothetical protein
MDETIVCYDSQEEQYEGTNDYIEDDHLQGHIHDHDNQGHIQYQDKDNTPGHNQYQDEDPYEGQTHYQDDEDHYQTPKISRMNSGYVSLHV